MDEIFPLEASIGVHPTRLPDDAEAIRFPAGEKMTCRMLRTAAGAATIAADIQFWQLVSASFCK